MRSAFFQRLDQLDAVVRLGPPAARYARDVAPLLQEPASEEYFFNRIDDLSWLADLDGAGVFDSPPATEHHPEEGTVSFPAWPAAGYLAKITRKAPKDVARIIRRIPATDNVRVHSSLMEAVLTMPAAVAAELASSVYQWIGSPYTKFYADDLGKLISHFARGGEVPAALALARNVLVVLPPESSVSAEPLSMLSPEAMPRTRVDSWDYIQILEKNLPDLVSVTGTGALVLLSDLLYAAVVYSMGERPGTRDFSEIWYPDLESGSEARESIRAALVRATRDAAVEVAKRGASGLRDAITIFDAKGLQVFERLSLYLLDRHPAIGAKLARERLLRPKYLYELFAYPEYASLLGARFDSLPRNQQRAILGRIDAGPDTTALVRRQTSGSEAQQIKSETQAYVRRWKRDRLAILRGSLPEGLSAELDALITEFGMPESPSTRIAVSGWTGPESPISADALGALGDDDLVKYLREWAAEQEIGSPSAEGLAGELSSLTKRQPSRLSALAREFRGLRLIYVPPFLQALEDRIAAGEPVDWPSVLDLCLWCVQRPPSVGDQAAAYGGTAEWSEVRRSVVRVLEAGLSSGGTTLPIEFRRAIWDILMPLTEDPEPTPEYEQKYGGANMDPLTLSLNTVRGKAIHAVIEYALWLTQGREGESNAYRLTRGFVEAPEVESVLDRHLNPDQDPSLAVRAVYGRWFPWLLSIDATWASSHADAIFPAGSSEQDRELWDAAWHSFISYTNPYDAVLPVLHGQYEHAIQLGNESGENSRRRDRPAEALGAHLMTFYWRGLLDLRPDGLVSQFFVLASPEQRSRALSFIGRSLKNLEQPLPDTIRTRLEDLWEHRLTAARESVERPQFASELAAFAWWFDSEKFDPQWAVAQFRKTVRLGAVMEHRSYTVVERLAVHAEEFPVETVETLYELVNAKRDRWVMHRWKEPARRILEVALASEEHQATARAVEIIDILGREGFFEFRPLLSAQG